MEAEYAKARGINQRIHEEMQKFKEMETDENREDIRTLRALVLLNEKLKRQEEQVYLWIELLNSCGLPCLLHYLQLCP